MSDDPNAQAWRPMFSRRIEAGHILQAGMMAVALIVYLTGSSNKTDEALRKADEIKLSLSSQIVDLKTDVGRGLGDIRTQIAALPDVTARLTQSERRLETLERIEGVQASDISHLSVQEAQDHAEIENLKHGDHTK